MNSFFADLTFGLKYATLGENYPKKMNQIAYLVALQLVNGLGAVRLKNLLDHFKLPRSIWEADLAEIINCNIPKPIIKNLQQIRKTIDPHREYQKIVDQGISVVDITDPKYPISLKQIHNPPALLFISGQLPSLDLAIGVVGTRQITGYGRNVTRQITSELVQSGFTIVSGLARGVDTVAHQTAVDFEGKTVAVLGGGINQLFPAENTRLAQAIVEKYGAVVSEYHPDMPALPGNFPARNRIIAGLSQGIVVTEATIDSGSLITAKIGLDEGKNIYAVPGPINSLQSQGPLSLIKDGATLVTEARDILLDFGHYSKDRSIKSVELLNELEYRIITLLANEKTHMDELTRKLGKPVAAIAASLLKLEIEGFVYHEGNGFYSKNL